MSGPRSAAAAIVFGSARFKSRNWFAKVAMAGFFFGGPNRDAGENNLPPLYGNNHCPLEPTGEGVIQRGGDIICLQNIQ